MNLRNNLSLLARNLLSVFGLRLVRLATNKVRGIDPILDVKSLLAGNQCPFIIDVGANDGETVAEFLKHFPDARLVAFEPFDQCYDILQSLYGGKPNVRVENAAVGAALGKGSLNVFSANRMNSLLEMSGKPENIMKDKFAKTGAKLVAVDTLDNYCVTNNIGQIDALKIDTQGYDLNVLRGAVGLLAKHRIRTVLLEINFIPMYDGQSTFGEIHGFLASFGYQLVDFYNHTRQNGYIAWCDACYSAPDQETEASTSGAACIERSDDRSADVIRI